MKNRLHRAATWWWTACALHALWIILLIIWMSDSSLEEPLIEWVEQHHTATQADPDYMVAYGYILDGLLAIFALGIVSLIVASVLQVRENRFEGRIKRGLCPACAYPVGASDVCTECGKPVKA